MLFGGAGGHTLQALEIARRLEKKVGYAARELAAVFSVTRFLVTLALAGQMLKMPPPFLESVSAHLLLR